MIMVINITITGCRLKEGAHFYPAFVYAGAIFHAPVTHIDHRQKDIQYNSGR